MTRIAPLELASATPIERETLLGIEKHHGSATNMKRTLARSPAALHALLTWYPLRDRALAFLGARGISLFCHAISTGSECLLCSTYFRRELIDAGEDPGALHVEDPLAAVVEYGALLASNPNAVPDELWQRLRKSYSDTELVDLTAFGALMIATNVFNNALQVELDPSLTRYRAADEVHA
jgi:alkylhydroperoxidase family enzyme